MEIALVEYASLFWNSWTADDARDDIASHTRVAVDRFDYREKLGQGGFGTVWKVYDRWVGHELALKISTTPMRDEVKVLRSLPRDCFVNTFDYIKEDGAEGYLMELLQHPWVILPDFFARFHEQTPYARGTVAVRAIKRAKAAIQVFIQLLNALRHLHGQPYSRQNRWCHGDVKPLNTWVNSNHLTANIKHWGSTERQFVKLGDLGLVVKRQENFSGAGTPVYVAPEQAQRRAASASADVFSAGQTLMFMLTGDPLERLHVTRIRESLADIPSDYLRATLSDLVRDTTFFNPNARLSASKAVKRASRILDDNREWIVFETFAELAPENGLSLSNAAYEVFERYAYVEGWKRRTDARLGIVQDLIRGMYESGKILRQGHSYFL